MPLPEFSYVTTVQDNATPAGILTAGAEGTILTVYPATRTYMIEFYEPLRCVETVAWDNVVPVGLDDIPLPEPSYEDRLRTRERFIAIVRRKLGERGYAGDGLEAKLQEIIAKLRPLSPT